MGDDLMPSPVRSSSSESSVSHFDKSVSANTVVAMSEPGVVNTGVEVRGGVERRVVEKEAVQPSSIFTTFRTHTIGGVHCAVALDYHIERLFSNAQSLGITSYASVETLGVELRKKIESAISSLFDARPAAQESSLRIRAVLPTTTPLEVFVEPYIPAWEPHMTISLSSVRCRRLFPTLKSSEMRASVDARRNAREHGASEALLVTPGSFKVKEGAWTNVFWVNGQGVVCTPEHGMLPGITRRILLEEKQCEQRECSLQELLQEAREVFVTQSTTGITPVRDIDGVAIGESCPGPVTANVIALYRRYIETKAEPLV